MSKRKWGKGQAILSMTRFMANFEEGRGVYFNNKYMSYGWLQNWSLHQIMSAVDRPYPVFFEAVPVEKP